MKKLFEIILLDVLWLSATILFASFWFDIRFGFNIFYGQHWNYLAVQQLTLGSVLPSFYISIALFVVLGITGLYFISRPHSHKKDSLVDTMQSKAQPEPQNFVTNLKPTMHDPNHSPLPPAPTLPRPPRIINPLFSPITTPAPSAPIPMPIQSAPVTENTNTKLAEIFTSSGYIAKQPPKINGINLNLWAVGMDEVLYLGLTDTHGGDITAVEGGESKWRGENGELFTSPVWRISSAMEKVRELFLETLDSEIQITIKAVVVMNNANITNRESLEKIWNAFGVEVFDSADSLAEYMEQNKNREMQPDEQEDLDAYSDYIETVSNYFNKT